MIDLSTAMTPDELRIFFRSELARKAGSTKTPKKAAASRENGKKGGRPIEDQRVKDLRVLFPSA
jgi:hypothetical protein